jgi:hypothetical protein
MPQPCPRGTVGGPWRYTPVTGHLEERELGLCLAQRGEGLTMAACGGPGAKGQGPGARWQWRPVRPVWA